LKSISRDPSKFILPAYSLRAGAAYTVALSLGDASASVGILVAAGRVHSLISGGLFRSMREQTTLTLDASPSYDEDVATMTGARAGLRFVWYAYITVVKVVVGGSIYLSIYLSTVIYSNPC
jgi:hypothetical protein